MRVKNTISHSKKKEFTKNKLLIKSYYLLVFIWTLLIGAAKGGRWDLNDQIFTGKRIITNIQTAYDFTKDFDFPPTSVYSVFQPIILGIGSRVTDLEILEALVIFIIAPAITTILYATTCKLSIELSTIITGKKYQLLIYSFGLILFSRCTFYIFYSSEIKPDSIALIFLTFSIYALIKEAYYKARGHISIKNQVILYSSVILSCLTKQQILLPYIVMGLSLLPCKELRKNGFFIILFAFGSCIVPSILIPGYFRYTILAFVGTHKYPFIATLIKVIKSFAYSGIPVVILLLSTHRKNWIKKPINFQEYLDKLNPINKSKSISTKHFNNNIPINSVVYITIPLVILSWLFAQILSTWNYGGNEGNTQAGIIYFGILFLPYILISIEKFLRIKLAEQLSKTGLVFILILSINLSVNVSKSFIKEGLYINRDNKYAQELSSRKIVNYPLYVDGDTAMIAYRAGIKSLNSFNTPLHLSHGQGTREKSIQQFVKYLENKNEGEILEYFTKSSIKKGTLFDHPTGAGIWLQDMFEVKREECFLLNAFYCNGELLIKKS